MPEKIPESKLTNCLMLPFQEPKDLPFSLSSADVAVVTPGKDSSKLSVPSKTYNLMSVGMPLLCIADEDSDLAAVVRNYNIGQSFDASNLQVMKSFLMELISNTKMLNKYSSNALKASKDFGVENARRFVS